MMSLHRGCKLLNHAAQILNAGKLRLKVGGGHGGHNGLRSIDAHCGKDYRRMRIGIGHPGDKARVHGHVLGDFAKVDAEWLEPLLDAIADNADMIARGEDSQFMNKVALATGGKAPKAEKPARPQIAAGQSHIRQARQNKPVGKLPTKGPMADMLRKLLGNKDD